MKKAYETPKMIGMISFDVKDVITTSVNQETILRDPFVSDWE